MKTTDGESWRGWCASTREAHICFSVGRRYLRSRLPYGRRIFLGRESGDYYVFPGPLPFYYLHRKVPSARRITHSFWRRIFALRNMCCRREKVDIHPRVYGRETALYIGRGGVGFPYVAFLLFFLLFFFGRVSNLHTCREKNSWSEEKRRRRRRKKNCIFRRTFFLRRAEQCFLACAPHVVCILRKRLEEGKKKGPFS